MKKILSRRNPCRASTECGATVRRTKNAASGCLRLDSGNVIFYKHGRLFRTVTDGSAEKADAQVAQLVEQRIENPRVGGSNPPLGTIFPVIA